MQALVMSAPALGLKLEITWTVGAGKYQGEDSGTR